MAVPARSGRRRRRVLFKWTSGAGDRRDECLPARRFLLNVVHRSWREMGAMNKMAQPNRANPILHNLQKAFQLFGHHTF